jgi:hypothetical protein
LIPEKRGKVYKTFEGLSEKLHRPIDPETIVVIVASNREKLSEVSPLRRILGDFRSRVGNLIMGPVRRFCAFNQGLRHNNAKLPIYSAAVS